MATDRELKAVKIKNASATLTLPTSTATLSTLALSETLTNKTLTAPTINSAVTTALGVSDYEEFTEVAAPSSPAATKHRVYFKSDGKMYRKNSGGTETEVGAGTNLYAIAENNAAQTFTHNAGPPEIVRYDNVLADASSTITTGAGWRFTAPSSGLYQISATISINSVAAATAISQAYFFVNGALGSTFWNDDSIGQIAETATQAFVLSASDYLEVRYYHVNAASITRQTDYAASGPHRISIIKLA